MRAIRFAFVSCGLAAWTSVAACSSSSGSSLQSGPTQDAATDGPTGMGDDDSGGSVDASDAASAMYPATKPTDVPQVQNYGGPVMASPKIVPIFFDDVDDAMTVASVKDFVAKVGGTHYWSALSEYGVGAATGETPIDLHGTDDPPATWDDSAIQTWVAAKIADGTLPAPDANTVYTIFTPPGVTVTMTYSYGGPPSDAGVTDGGDAGSNTVVSQSCVDFGGYHDNIDYGPDGGTQPVAYAVVPRCKNFGTLLSGLDAITGPASHELSEAATDPFPSDNPAFATVDPAHSYWSRLLGGGEIGDMCAQNPQSFTKFTELPYMVQRIWSNAAVKEGTDPCLPVPGSDVYFNSYPVVSDMISTTFQGQTVTMKGVKIAVGASKQVEVDLASTGPTTGPWTVEALDQSQLAGATTSTYLGISLDKTSGQNGDKIMMTITVKKAGRRNTEPFLIVSKMGTGATEQVNFWAGIVGN